MFPFLIQPRIIIILCAVLGAAALGVGIYFKGHSNGVDVTEAKYAKEKLLWEQLVTAQQKEFDGKVDTLTKSFNEEKTLMQDQIKKLQGKGKSKKKVIVEKFVPQQITCTIPVGFVELHNTAAAGKELPDAPQGNAATPSDKNLTEVSSTVATNYYQCNEVISQLRTLQNVVKQYQQQQQKMTEK